MQLETENPLRVLLVDEDPNDLKRYHQLLEPEGSGHFRLAHAAGIDAAEALLDIEHFDCVLIDQHDEQQRISENLGRLSLLLNTDDVPVIVIGNQAGPYVDTDTLNRNAIDYINRASLSASTCSHAVKNAVEKAGLRRAVREQSANLLAINETVTSQEAEIRDFYHTICHEVRTPLMGIREFIGIALDGIESNSIESQKALLTEAMNGCDTMAAVFNDLVDSSRLAAGKVTPNKTKTSPTIIIQRCIVAAKPALAAKNLEMDLRIADNLPDLHVDAGRIVQALSSLLSNAIKFTAPGGRISVFARPDKERPCDIEIGITDTGCGIATTHIPRIFDRLYQVGMQDDEIMSPGLGLGLSIARDIVELHHGTISVRSVPGVGSTFIIGLPVTQPSQDHS